MPFFAQTGLVTFEDSRSGTNRFWSFLALAPSSAASHLICSSHLLSGMAGLQEALVRETKSALARCYEGDLDDRDRLFDGAA